MEDIPARDPEPALEVEGRQRLPFDDEGADVAGPARQAARGNPAARPAPGSFSGRYPRYGNAASPKRTPDPDPSHQSAGETSPPGPGSTPLLARRSLPRPAARFPGPGRPGP